MAAIGERQSCSDLAASARTLADLSDGVGETLANAGQGEGLGVWCGRGRARRTPQGMQDRPLDLSKSPWAAHATASVAPAQRRSSQRAVLPCGVCGKSFDRPSLLKRHTRTHTGEKPHVCDVCSKGFSTSSSLNTHRRIHSGEKPHECQTCGKRFTASSNLYYHRMTHTKEKPHKCVECDKSFPTPGDLKAHRYIHTGSWPYRCVVCNRGFSKHTNLRNHAFLHTVYRCVVCNRGFSKHTNLRNHAFLHTGDRPHPCTLCGKKFALACNLRAHTKTHHHEHVAGIAAPAQTPLAQSTVAQLSRPRAGVKSPDTINRQFEYHEPNHLIYHRAERPKIKPEPKSPDPQPGDQKPNFTDLLANLAAPASNMSLLEDFWMKQVAFQGHGQHCSLNGHQQFAFLPSLQPPLMASLSLVELQTLLFVQANMAGYFKHGPLDGTLDDPKMRHSSHI